MIEELKSGGLLLPNLSRRQFSQSRGSTLAKQKRISSGSKAEQHISSSTFVSFYSMKMFLRAT
jgi:hypothetical protein